jgi:hypothetical protein
MYPSIGPSGPRPCDGWGYALAGAVSRVSASISLCNLHPGVRYFVAACGDREPFPCAISAAFAGLASMFACAEALHFLRRERAHLRVCLSAIHKRLANVIATYRRKIAGVGSIGPIRDNWRVLYRPL